jgi:Helicase associated domain
MVTFNVLSTERQDWYRGYAAARRYAHRERHLLVPYEHRDPDNLFPLGQWIGEQRKVFRAGRMSGRRARRLEALGMVWSVADLQFAENLAAARVAFAEWGTLCLPRAVTALQRPVGQWLTNCRRPNGLGTDPERAATRARQLAEVDPDWNPDWPADWQRLYTAVRGLLAGGAALADVVPGVTVRGEDAGRWLQRQREHAVWVRLSDGQREKLTGIGVEPLPAPVPQKAVKGRAGALGAFERGLAALRLYKAREGHLRVPRGHVEVLEDGAADGSGEDAAQRVEVKLGVWISNTKTRRAKLSADKLTQLAELGLDWT